MSDVDVSAVLVSWNTRGVHEEAIDAFAAGCGRFRHELIVVDNGSTDGGPEALRRAGTGTVIELGTNTGFTNAANVGARAATGRYVLFLNPDAVVVGGAVGALVDVLDGRDDAWGATPWFRNPDGTPQHFYLRLPGTPSLLLCFTDTGRAVDRRLGSPARRRRYYTELPDPPGLVPIDCVGAACLLVRRQEFLELGGFDPRFDNFFQDGDLARRMQRRGRVLLGVGHAEVTHSVGVTLARMSAAEREGRFLRDFLRYLEDEPPLRRALGRAAVALERRRPRRDAAALRAALDGDGLAGENAHAAERSIRAENGSFRRDIRR